MISLRSLNHLTNLRTLSITNSALVEVDGLDHNYNLQTLLLDGNQIRALKKKNIRMCPGHYLYPL
jgi:Leucine-rich repeat (LRR) protein